MKSQEVIDESSGYSLQGSYTPDLVFSKLWLVYELERYLKSQNIKIGTDTAVNYLRHLVSGYLIYRADRFDIKGRRLLELNEKYPS